MSFPQLPFGGLRSRRVSIFSSNLVLEPVVLEAIASDIKIGVSDLAIAPIGLETNASEIKFGVSDLAINPVELATNVSDIKIGVSDLAIAPIGLETNASEIKFGVSDLAINPVELATNVSEVKLGVSDLVIPQIISAVSVRPSTPWTPANITTQLWLDAADASTITTVSGGVSQWNDKSGNNRHSTQATNANRPTVLSANINSLDVLSFDNSNDAMTTGWNLSATNNYMIFSVANLNTGSGFRRMIASTTNNSHITPINGGNPNQAIQIKNSDVSSQWATGGTSNLSVLVAPPTGNFLHFSNGSQRTINSVAVTDWGILTLGKLAVYSEPMDGKFCELVVTYSSDTTTRQLVEGYLAHKWGLTANLPSDHPYKAASPIT